MRRMEWVDSTGQTGDLNSTMAAKRASARRRATARGFTLIELLIVIAIILALAGIVGVALFQRQDEANEDLTRVDIKTLQRGLDEFRLHFDRYPSTDETVAVLWDKTLLEDPEEEDKWRGYLREPLAEDRWGNEWEYEQLSRSSYKLWSIGPDGTNDEGDAESDDILETFSELGSGDDMDGEGFGGDDLPGMPTGS